MEKKQFLPVTLRVIPVEQDVIMTSNPNQQTEDYSISKVNNIQENDWE